MKKFLLFTLLLILYAGLQAIPQEIPNGTERPELITDRPDQTESAATSLKMPMTGYLVEVLAGAFPVDVKAPWIKIHEWLFIFVTF